MIQKGLHRLFNPRSIGVIGASNAPQKVGNNLLSNLKSSGYRGKLYPINLNDKVVLNLKAYKSVLNVPGSIDLALIAIPSEFTVRAVEECGMKHIPFAIVISAGFKETGEHGRALQDELVRVARVHNVRILGPNCLGIINLSNNINASFASIVPKKGNIGFISQSGALCSSFLSLSVDENFGFSKFISIGNKVDLDESDFLEYLGEDKDTDVILLYLESLNDGRRFMDVARKINKPIIMIKAGATVAGAKAVSSHTGAMAGRDKLFDAALKQAGIIRVGCFEDLFNAAELFSKVRRLDNDKLLIVTNGGGLGVITIDCCIKKGIQLADLSDASKAKISSLLPSNVKVGNPVDVIGDAPAKRFEGVLRVAMKDPNVGVILVIVTPQSMTEIVETAELVIGLSKGSSKPIISNFIGREKRMEIAHELLNESNVPAFEFPEMAVDAVDMLNRFNKFQRGVSPRQIAFDKDRVKAIIHSARVHKHTSLSLKEGFALLDALGTKAPRQIFSKSLNDIRAFLKNNSQIILKVDAPSLQHKTESKLISRRIETEAELDKEFQRLSQLGSRFPEFNLCAQAFISGRELIVGALYDSTFGAAVSVGIGGIMTELMKDIVFRVPPLSDEEVDTMLKELKGFKLLKGFRNLPGVDIGSIKHLVHALGTLILNFPEIAEIEVNPLIATADTALAVDVLVTLH